MPKYTLETVFQVWDDQHGSRVEVGPDRDGLDLVEVRSVADDGVVSASITMTPEQALLVAQAIIQACKAVEIRGSDGVEQSSHDTE